MIGYARVDAETDTPNSCTLASHSTADSVRVSLRVVGDAETDTQTQTEPARILVHTDVALATDRLNL